MFSREPIELRYSSVRMVGLALLGVLMAALCIYMFRAASLGKVVAFTYLPGVIFFGACAVLGLIRLIRDRGKAVIRLTDTGFTDIRVAREEIPWREIQAIKTRAIVLQKFLVLDVDPAFEATLSLKPIVRRSRKANNLIGVAGLATTSMGLQLSHKDLLTLCNERWHASRQNDGRVT